MQKKLMAVAVASAVGALVAPTAAVAQTSTVQIGGSLTMFYYSHNPNNPALPVLQPAGTTGVGGTRGDILEMSEPEMFIRGEEKLGGGLSAWFQCTSSLDGMVTGASTALGFCGRNSGIGMKGNFGNIFAGNWDQPQKLVFNRARGWFGGTNSFTGGTARLLNNDGASGTQNPIQTIAGGFSTAGTTELKTVITNNPAAFYRRQASSWNYHSPSWNGLQIQAAFSARNDATAIPAASPLKPRLWSVAGHYDSGPLYLGVGYERHNDYNPGNIGIGTTATTYAGGTDDNWTLVGGYKVGPVSVRGMYSRSEYDVTNTTGVSAKGWGLWADWALGGPHTLRAQYAKVGDASGTTTGATGNLKGPLTAGCGATSTLSCATNTGARVWSVFYSYAFSKRTEGSIGYTKLSNESNANFSLGKVASTAGNSQSSGGIVLKHRF